MSRLQCHSHSFCTATRRRVTVDLNFLYNRQLHITLAKCIFIVSNTEMSGPLYKCDRQQWVKKVLY